MGFTRDGEDTVLTIMGWMTQTDTVWRPNGHNSMSGPEKSFQLGFFFFLGGGVQVQLAALLVDCEIKRM